MVWTLAWKERYDSNRFCYLLCLCDHTTVKHLRRTSLESWLYNPFVTCQNHNQSWESCKTCIGIQFSSCSGWCLHSDTMRNDSINWLFACTITVLLDVKWCIHIQQASARRGTWLLPSIQLRFVCTNAVLFPCKNDAFKFHKLAITDT
jgi:hypothetical protein